MNLVEQIAAILRLATPPEQLPPGERYIQREAIERKIEELEELDRWEKDQK